MSETWLSDRRVSSLRCVSKLKHKPSTHPFTIYRLLDQPGLGVKEMPGVDQPIGETIGDHDITSYDWQQYLNFADRHFGRGSSEIAKPRADDR